MQNSETCKNCGTKLIVRATQRKASQLKKPYYYTAYYFCPNCKKLYHDEKFKVVNSVTDLLQLDTSTPNTKYDVEIWTDGACSNNGYVNAKAAWAFVSNETEQAGLVDGKQTNNVAEALAIYFAIRWAVQQGHTHIKIYSDSQISINNMKKSPSEIKQNSEIFHNIANLINVNHLVVHFEKVLGHSGDINNERADKLANGLVGKK